MNRRWRVHEDADSDVENAVEWYERERAGVGMDLRRAVREALAELRATPSMMTSVPRARRGRRLWRFLLRRFPYAIVVLETDEEYVVVAVAHLRRHPNYWKKRLKSPSP